MKTIRWSHLFLTLCFSCTLYGCAAVVVGGAGVAATYNYFEGKLTISRNVTVTAAYDAGIRAANDLGLIVEKKSKTLTEASISGKDGDRPFWIWIIAENAVSSKISVRVGLLGDRMASERIQQSIKKFL